VQPRNSSSVVHQRAQLAVSWVLDDGAGAEAGKGGDGVFARRVRGDVVEVYAGVGGASCEEDLLWLVGGWG
jgi:hypothetical protein